MHTYVDALEMVTPEAPFVNIDWLPAKMSNYIPYRVWDEITYPVLNGVTIEKFGNGYVITPHTLLGISLHILKINPWQGVH